MSVLFLVSCAQVTPWAPSKAPIEDEPKQIVPVEIKNTRRGVAYYNVEFDNSVLSNSVKLHARVFVAAVPYFHPKQSVLDGTAALILSNEIDTEHPVTISAPIKSGEVTWSVYKTVKNILGNSGNKSWLVGSVEVNGQWAQDVRISGGYLWLHRFHESEMKRKSQNCSNNWIQLYNGDLEGDKDLYPTMLELFYQCLEKSKYIRISEKLIEYTFSTAFGNLDPLPIEIEYMLWREAEYYRKKLEKGERDEDTLEGASISWRRLARLRDKHIFSVLSILRIKELLDGDYSIGGVQGNLIPLGMARWEFTYDQRGYAYGLGDIGKQYFDAATSYRRPALLYLGQKFLCVLSVLIICPIRYDDAVYLNGLRSSFPGYFQVIDKQGHQIQLPNLEKISPDTLFP